MQDSGPSAPIEALAELAGAFDNLKIPYLTGGSFASSTHGEYRATNDLDILCKLELTVLPALFTALRTGFIIDEIAVRTAVTLERSCNIIHEASFIKVDLFTKCGPYQLEQLKRAVDIRLPGHDRSLKVAAPEDIILAKLTWYKNGGCVSERQWRDILGVIRVQGTKLDLAYLQEHAKSQETVELLAKARNACGGVWA